MADAPLATALPPLLTTARLGRVHRALTTTGSTNADALAWAADGAPDGALVTADHQAAGRGRHGRTWVDAEGQSLLASVVLRPALPASALGVLPLAAGLAVADAVARTTGLNPRLKWPNDVLLVGRKVCGILLESRLTASAATVVLGIGLNVGQASFPPEIADRATSLLLETGRTVPRAPLLAALLAHLEARLDALTPSGAGTLPAAFEARMVGLGARVRIAFPQTDRPPLEGTLLGLAPDGALRLATAEGEQRLHAGEVTLAAADRRTG